MKLLHYKTIKLLHYKTNTFKKNHYYTIKL